MYELLVRRRSGSKGARHYNDKNSIYRLHRHNAADIRNKLSWRTYRPSGLATGPFKTAAIAYTIINYK